MKHSSELQASALCTFAAHIPPKVAVSTEAKASGNSLGQGQENESEGAQERETDGNGTVAARRRETCKREQARGLASDRDKRVSASRSAGRAAGREKASGTRRRARQRMERGHREGGIGLTSEPTRGTSGRDARRQAPGGERDRRKIGRRAFCALKPLVTSKVLTDRRCDDREGF